MLVIVDYGLSNIASIVNMMRKLGQAARVSDRVDDVLAADRLVLPGVGSFDAGVRRLRETGLDAALDRRVRTEGVPLLGLCLGMQLLGRRSEEGTLAGLGFVDAEVVRFPPSTLAKVPHMGWSEIRIERPHPVFVDLPVPSRFYFVHSFHVVCDHIDDVVATAAHGRSFCAAFAHGNIAGVQFHPEKSHRFGMKLLANFLAWTPT